jgi:hypothetical protein
MATIRIRRGTTTPSASSFAEGEAGFDMTAGKLYIKNSSGIMVDISGRMDITEQAQTSTHIYYGGLKNGLWKINRFAKSGFVKTSATQANNGSVTNLSDAWTNRLTLTYG